ncbi:MAG: SRPBCC family protein, partial [Bacteroidota bacterium]|nr:SRPBCC family protein [Bacteroidota bacterium]
MSHYVLKRTQKLPISLDLAWDFFSSPDNLAEITPPYMGFEVLSNSDSVKMYPGQIITYYVRPLFGFKLFWMTEITHVADKNYFVDEQRFGPYAMWHHTHFF